MAFSAPVEGDSCIGCQSLQGVVAAASAASEASEASAEASSCSLAYGGDWRWEQEDVEEDAGVDFSQSAGPEDKKN